MPMARRALMVRMNRERLSGRLVVGVSGTAAIKVANILLGAATVVLLGRFLGPDGFGLYALAIVIIQLIGIPINIGLRNLLMRETARLQQSETWAELHGLLRRAFQVVTGSSLLLICAGGGLLLAIRASLDGQVFVTYSLALLLFPLLGLLAVVGGVLIGLRHAFGGQLPDLVLRQVLLITILLGLYAFGLHAVLTPSGAVVAAVLAAGASAVVAVVLLFRHLPREVVRAAPTYQDRLWLRSLVPFSMIAGIAVVQSKIDIVMLGALTNHETVGLYRVATQGATLVAFALQAVNMIVGPYFARLYAAGETERLQRLLRHGVFAIVALALPVFCIYLLWAGPLIGAIFGNAFRPAATTLVILSAGQLVSAWAGSAGLLLTMTGHERDIVRCAMFTAAFNVVMNLPMILLFGMEGAAISTALSLAILNVFLARRAYQRVGVVTYLNPMRWGKAVSH